MPFELISATPSPFARMNRIAMLEKGIPFELRNEVPWHNGETETPNAHIQEYIIQKFADKGPKLLTGDIDLDLKARQIQTLAEGMLDAFVLEWSESIRPKEKQSSEWKERQSRKLDGGMRAFDELVRKKKGEYLVGDGSVFTIADIAVACAVAHIEFAQFRPGWQEQYPELAKYWKRMDEKDSFAKTRPFMFDIDMDRVHHSKASL